MTPIRIIALVAVALVVVRHSPRAEARDQAPRAVAANAALSGVGYADRDEWGTWRGQKVQGQ